MCIIDNIDIYVFLNIIVNVIITTSLFYSKDKSQ